MGVDRMEGPLTSALSVLNILFTSQITNKDKHCVRNLCKGKNVKQCVNMPMQYTVIVTTVKRTVLKKKDQKSAHAY